MREPTEVHIEMKKSKNTLEKMKKNNDAEKMTLDQIETEMEQLAMNEDISKVFLCSQRIDMLEKVANFKIKKMQLQIAKEQSESGAVKPITVNFTSSKTDAQTKRIETIENEVKVARGEKVDA